MGCGDQGAGLDGDAQLRQRHAGARFRHRQHPARPRDLVLAGGVDALSRAHCCFRRHGALAVAVVCRENARRACAAAARFRPGMLVPVIGLLKGLTDPVMASDGTDRREPRAPLRHRAHADGLLLDAQPPARRRRAGRRPLRREVVPVADGRVKVYTAADDGVRRDSSVPRLAKLKPVFDRRTAITAGNSSQVTDGGAWLLLASQKAVMNTAEAARPHRRHAVGGPRSGADGAGPGACGDADPAAPRSWPQRSRRLGNQRSLRRPGHRLHRGVEKR
jgi:acetyl-CoA acetyltransferase